MKSVFAFALLGLSTLTVVAQDKYLDSISFELTQDIDFFKDIKNNTEVNTYIMQDGNRLSVGDTIYLSTPTAESSLTNAAETQSLFGRNRATARTTTNAMYAQVQLGKFSGLGATMATLGGEQRPMAGQSLQGSATIIREIKLSHKGSKKKPLMVTLILGEPNDRAFGINKYLSVLDTEIAYELGEIELANRLLTREEAIAKLKEAKDLLDLEMMSQSEYEAIRSELEPIIKQKSLNQENAVCYNKIESSKP